MFVFIITFGRAVLVTVMWADRNGFCPDRFNLSKFTSGCWRMGSANFSVHFRLQWHDGFIVLAGTTTGCQEPLAAPFEHGWGWTCNAPVNMFQTTRTKQSLKVFPFLKHSYDSLEWKYLVSPWSSCPIKWRQKYKPVDRKLSCTMERFGATDSEVVSTYGRSLRHNLYMLLGCCLRGNFKRQSILIGGLFNRNIRIRHGCYSWYFRCFSWLLRSVQRLIKLNGCVLKYHMNFYSLTLLQQLLTKQHLKTIKIHFLTISQSTISRKYRKLGITRSRYEARKYDLTAVHFLIFSLLHSTVYYRSYLQCVQYNLFWQFRRFNDKKV